MSGYKIDNDVPAPLYRRSPRTGETPYPFDSMGVGQSFKVPLTEKDTLRRVRNRINFQIVKRRKSHPRQKWLVAFMTAQQEKDGVPGVRVWRDPDEAES